MKQKLKLNRKKILFLICLVIILALPLLGLSRFYMRLAVFGGIYTLLATSLNFVSGVAGQVSLGHAAFFGIGAYTSALLSLKADLNFVLCLIIAGLFAGLIGYLVAVPSMKLSGGYLAIVTLGFGQIVYIVLLNWIDLTRGPMGLVGIPAPVIFGIEFRDPSLFYIIVIVCCFIVLGVFNRLLTSKFGRNLRAIRDDEIAASAMGVDVYKDKIKAFAISSFVAGIAGSVYAHFMLFIDPSKFVGDESTAILSMVVLGGLGNMVGSIISAILLTVLPELLRGFSDYRMLTYGILLVSMMLLKTVDWNNYAWFRKLKERFKKPIQKDEG